jgi:ATP-GRASP peptide maturase of grasp-with-spasm system
MILIISQNNSEKTTNDVLDWLGYYKANHKRINGVEALFDYEYQISSEVKLNVNSVKESENTTVWFRRWLPSEFYYVKGGVSPHENLNRQITDYLRQEGGELRVYFLNTVKYKHILSDFAKVNINKITVLNKAEQVGLKIPASLITASKESLVAFREKHKNIIVKNIKDVGFFAVEENFYVSYTSLINDEDIEKLPAKFFPSLFQETIDKLYEVRVFYLDGDFYSMAIFSQSNKKTTTDFRNYDYVNPNRNIPYNLPESIKIKLKKLMDDVELNCGSIDLLFTTSQEYVFLEINPIGQFGFLSDACNYFLERKVAKWLINKDKQ